MLYDIQHVHLELSSLCNARCPFCPRNFHGYPYNFGYQETNLSLKDTQKIFTPEIAANLREILINGNFGDFVMNPQSADIIEYFLQHNPNVHVIVSTNGSARDRQFWQKLGSLGILIEFCIDGLEDTNHLYRQDTNFDNIMRNAGYFIEAGGEACWKMIKFDFNKDQRDRLYNLAMSMGFKLVRMQDSVRNRGPVFDRTGKKIHVIQQDQDHMPDQISDQWVQDQLQKEAEKDLRTSSTVNISCWAKRNHSVYVAADGHVYPCCWVGFNPPQYRPLTTHRLWNEEMINIIEHNHAPTVGLHAAVEWFDRLAESWQSSSQPHVCKFFCKETT